MAENQAEQHVKLKCSNCEKDLVDIWFGVPSQQVFKLRATCPYCGDKSFIKEIKGNFFLGAPNDELSCTNINYGEDLVIINVEKNNE